jgi:type IV pilus assembly protein PilV
MNHLPRFANMKNSKHFPMPLREYGFAMVEVLVTLMIVTLALFGTAGLQVYSLRFNQSGQFRGQAVLLAKDLVERMEANNAAMRVDGAIYAISPTNARPDTVDTCNVQDCNSTNLAAYDKAQWQNAVANLLPESSWSVTTTVTNSLVFSTITLTWLERSASATNDTTAGSQALTATYVATRLIKL